MFLGSGEGGKSTIVKQMKIIHQNGYSRDELAKYKHVVYRNLVDSAQDIVRAMAKIGIAPAEPANRVSSRYQVRLKLECLFTLNRRSRMSFSIIEYCPTPTLSSIRRWRRPYHRCCRIQ
jgi:hypothetical protein